MTGEATPAAAMPADPLWYKDAVVYEVHVKAFSDSNGDGIGDFAGLTSKLDYIRDLGVNTIWLLPFYPSPFRDDGYDIADYHNIDPTFGTRRDFKTFVREAHRRGLRVITELVINHTSDQHPWFQAARRAPKGSPKRDYYVWSDDDRRYAQSRIIFTDTEKSNWTWDDVAQSYYWHRFFSHQPDLNFDNPRVLKAVIRTMRFWLDQGVDGLRLDAIPYLVEREHTSCENLPETHAVVKQIRAVIERHYGDRMLLAEANQWPEDVRDYFGDGDECHMAYHFPLMPRMYMAIAQEDRHPIVEILRQTPDIPDNCQWAIFLRNHDELTLEMVTSRERDYMYQMYAADPRARLNLGIRRRLAPLLDNDMDRIRLMNSLLLSMPGAPMIYYGDEIGMGDNIYLGDRNGVRTPMQWSPDRNAGFSRADPQRLFLPPIMDPVYGYEAVNVEAQARDPSSLLNWMRRVLAVRKSCHAFGRGSLQLLTPGNRKVLAYVRAHGDEIVLCVANLARSAQPVELDLSRYRGRVPVELLGRTPFPPVGEQPYFITLPGHGFYWFRLATGEDVPPWHEARPPLEDLPVMVLFDALNSLFRERVMPWRVALAERTRRQLEAEALPRFIVAQRWYAAKGVPLDHVALRDHAEWSDGDARWLLGLYEAQGAGQGGALYFVPVSLLWEERDDERMRGSAAAAVSRVRQHAHVGMLADALSDDRFCRRMLMAIATEQTLKCAHGTICFAPTHRFGEIAGADLEGVAVRSSGAQGTNTSVRLGERLFLKCYRQLRAGVNPEIEMGRYLTEVARFDHIVPVAGSAEYVAADGSVYALAVLHAHVANQGDCWQHATDYLARVLEGALAGGDDGMPASEIHGAYLALVETLARRVAGLHAALADGAAAGPAFAPEAVSAADLSAWSAAVCSEAEQALSQLAAQSDRLGTAERGLAGSVLARREVLTHRIERLAQLPPGGLRIRHHGDLHLGQVLLVQNDFVVIDFEGEPARPLAERRIKHSPLRDVAGMLRSFDYAAAAALNRVTATRPDDVARLTPHAAAWAQACSATFRSAYRQALAERDIVDWRTEPALLEHLMLEKALYELRYELNHRPDWVRIPLQGLLDLVAS